ncbi:hypothetical protein PR202_gb21156 [Eleusine coracana subsp. coracana]|uniref:Uncharacterized protein n=1 Tax=Eleusine coracana subsp. coracana TaxID=191504 RepID=A0AAV5FEF2_ELECO|nr:hypothetical protein PR202_gb21156 [Eleusine coracana subsp. coracana]
MRGPCGSSVPRAPSSSRSAAPGTSTRSASTTPTRPTSSSSPSLQVRSPSTRNPWLLLVLAHLFVSTIVMPSGFQLDWFEII